MPTRTLGEEVEMLDGALARLGGIPSHRIVYNPAPGTATEKDLLALMRRTGRLYELIDGVLVEKTMGYKEGSIALELGMHMRLHAKKHKLGNVAGADATMRLMPKLVRVPDVSFVRWEKFPGGHLPDKPIPDLVPDLAVEVSSKNNTAGEMQRKLKEYFLTGTSLVWIVDPATRTVKIHTAPDEFTTLGEDDSLDGATLLPGFHLPVRTLFEELPPPVKKRPARKKKP